MPLGFRQERGHIVQIGFNGRRIIIGPRVHVEDLFTGVARGDLAKDIAHEHRRDRKIEPRKSIISVPRGLFYAVHMAGCKRVRLSLWLDPRVIPILQGCDQLRLPELRRN